MPVTHTKQPSEVKQYDIDFTNLLADGYSMDSLTSITPSPATVDLTAESLSGNKALFTASGGVDGTLYTITAIGDAVNAAGTTETLEGEGFLYVGDLPAVSGALEYSYSAIKTAVADFLAWGRDSSEWTSDEDARLDAIIKSGVAQVYYPAAVSQGGTVHQWSWLRPTSSLTTSEPYSTGTVEVASGVVTLTGGTFPSWAEQGELVVGGGAYEVESRDGDTQLTLYGADDLDLSAGTAYTLARYLYDLPTDFNGFEGQMHYRREQGNVWPPIELVSDSMIRARRQYWTGTDRPRYAAIRPKTFAASVGQRWQAVFHPTPSDAWDLLYAYKVQPTSLTHARPFPLGGPEVGEAILQSCLAVAEQRYRDERGLHTEQFLMKLQAAIVGDAIAHSPDTLGYNADRSDGVRRDRFHGEAIHSYEGVYYYDQNP